MKRIGRRAFIARAVVLIAIGAASVDSVFGAIEALDPEILKTELRVKTDAEEAFIDDVVEKVKNGTLPVKYLQAAYRYAVQKDKARRLIYFKKCLEILTRQAGLKISFLAF